MTCLDCALAETVGDPIGTCIDCGAAVCARHAVVRQVEPPAGRTARLQRQLAPPPRAVRCHLCDHVRNPTGGREPAHHGAASTTRGEHRPSPAA